ncbi:hypothetical protein [Mucilaginibacter celer]|uniref:Uncharacterized protein n=1 Tax=Mucilaginibacter celer TaxID=2305508 RepID=A0A494VLK1_9SPHI|nr:hypothetical protein [Mucilaginibacter celer]AYL94969.1 hypothetical protein HYN43_006510 [Mucilaginibacter celer]
MKRIIKHIVLLLLAAGIAGPVSSCSGNPAAPAADTAKTVARSAQQKIHKAGITDEQLFRAFLKQFKAAALQQNKKQLAAMFYFPLQTTPQWSNDDLGAAAINPAEGLVSANEYPQYEPAILNADALRLIPKSTEDDLSEIDGATTENYYKTVGKVTDRGSTLYELQQQYVQKNGKETSYGFVFGKVNGQYKIISYYSPWPVKG